jgi:hypothetical protein
MNTLLIFIVISCCAPALFGQAVNPLSITRISPTQFQLSWHADTLRPYQIENSPDLFNWTALTGYIEGTNAQQGVLVTKTTDKMFYRLKNGAMRSGFNSNTLAPNDDGSTNLVPIGFPINVFPTTTNPGPWTECYVNNNGNLTIGTRASSYRPLPLQSSAQQIPGAIALIAPFWADVDTRPASNPVFANGCKAVTYGQGSVDSLSAFGINWSNVGYFSYKTEKLNSFQIILIDRSNIGNSGDFDVEFNYNEILWETGDHSSNGGINGYGGKVARVGITNGVDRTIELLYSGEMLKQLDLIPVGFPDAGTKNYTSGLIYRKRNSSVPGRHVFQFRNGNLIDALQVNAGPDVNPGSGASTITVTGTAADPSGGIITTLWSVIDNTDADPVTIESPSQLSTNVTFTSGARVSLQLTVKKASDPSITASDIMIIN